MVSTGSQVDEVQARVDRLRTAANEAAKFAVARRTTFLLVSVYLGIMVGTTTDEHLLRESGLTLPIFGVALPVVPFYAFIPLFYVLLHVNLISRHAILAPMLHKLSAALSELRSPAQQEEQRGLIHPSSFSHMYLQTATTLRMRFLLWVSVVVPLIVLPLLLLCWIQRQFLPYHSVEITWLHRLYVLVDLLVIWLYWPQREGHEDRERKEQKANKTGEATEERSSWAKRGFMRVAHFCSSVWAAMKRIFGIVMYPGVRVNATALIVTFTLVIATVPDRAMDGFWHALRHWDRDWAGALEHMLHRNLVLSEMILVKDPPPPELLAAYEVKGESLEQAWIEHAKGLDLRLRDLRYADFSESTLYRADFRGANLTKADLSKANLSKARFEFYERDDGTIAWTLLTDISLWSANLRGVDLRGAVLNRASLVSAKLHGANLGSAKLQGAKLKWAKLHGANLRSAKLQGADLESAELHGANLIKAMLHGANLRSAKLHGANLTYAELYGAILDEAEFVACNMRDMRIGADFSRATVTLCDLRHPSVKVLLNKAAWTELKRRVGREIKIPEVLRIVRKRFDKAAGRETGFPPSAKNISNCLVSGGPEWEEYEWRAKDEEGFERSLIDNWVQLACDNPWVAIAMCPPAQDFERPWKMLQRDRQARVASGFLKAYDKALAGEEACDGVKQLDETAINWLRKFAEQSQSQDRSGN